MKYISKICVLMLSLVMFVSSFSYANAADDTKAASKATNGVVQVNTVFTDQSGIKHILCGGSGFLIGDAEETEYVITCNHIVAPSDEVKVAGFEFLQIPNTDDYWSKISFQTEIVVEGDVVLSADVLNSSAELDLAVLKLSQPIYTRETLTVLTAKDYDTEKLPYATTEEVYALGFPGEIRYDSEVQYYSDQQVVMTKGNIVNLVNLNNVQVIESDASVDTNNCGGPLVDENGYVIGMNLLTKDGMYSCSLDSTKITKVLDGLGVQYSCVYEKPKKEEEKTEVQQQSTVEPEKKEFPLWAIIAICAGVVVVVATIVTIIIVKLIRKEPKEKKPKKKKKEQEDFSSSNDALARYVDKPNAATIKSLGSISENGSETMVLSGGLSSAGDTSVIGTGKSVSEQLKLGSLIRLKTGEKISINKSYFTIGKDNLHVDYCIKDNGTISRQHVIIRQAKEGIYLEDNNSTNGTWLNGKKVTFGRAELLRNGDLIKVSNEEFEYQV